MTTRLPGFDDLRDWTADKWATPPALVADMEREFGAFDLDPCCEEHTAKAPAFYTSGGLERPWRGRVWLNPPYSDPLPWLRRAVQATQEAEAALVVALLRVATDTAWFHDWVLPYAEIRFIRGRVKFLGGDERPTGVPPWASMFAIYRGLA